MSGKNYEFELPSHEVNSFDDWRIDDDPHYCDVFLSDAAIEWQDMHNAVCANLSPEAQRRLMDIEQALAETSAGIVLPDTELAGIIEERSTTLYKAYDAIIKADMVRVMHFIHNEDAMPKKGEVYADTAREELLKALDAECVAMGLTDEELEKFEVLRKEIFDFDELATDMAVDVMGRVKRLMLLLDNARKPDADQLKSLLSALAEASLENLLADLYDVVDLHGWSRPPEPTRLDAAWKLLAAKTTRSVAVDQSEYDRQISNVLDRYRSIDVANIIANYLQLQFVKAAKEALGEAERPIILNRGEDNDPAYFFDIEQAAQTHGKKVRGVGSPDEVTVKPPLMPLEYARMALGQELRNLLYGNRALSRALDQFAQEKGVICVRQRERRKVEIDTISEIIGQAELTNAVPTTSLDTRTEHHIAHDKIPRKSPPRDDKEAAQSHSIGNDVQSKNDRDNAARQARAVSVVKAVIEARFNPGY